MRYLTLACLLCSLSFIGCDPGDGSSEEDASFEAPVLEAPANKKSGEPTASELMEQLGLSGEDRALVAGGKIRKLDISQSNVKDLSPLANLTSLTFLNLALCPVEDLSALKGLPIDTLILVQSSVKDISPLAGMDLKVLDLTQTDVADLSPLQGMKLQELYLEGTGVTNLSPLKGMPLTQLNLFNTKLESIAGVEDLPLGTLWIPETAVKDLEPLRGKTLQSLDLAKTTITSLDPLKGMVSLQRLNLEGSAVTDLTPLEGLQLQRLVFTPSKIEKGIEVVRNMPTLTQLWIDSDFQRNLLPAAEFWAKYDAGTLE